LNLVFDLGCEGNIGRAVRGEKIGTLITSDAGIRTSRRRVLRLMRENRLLAHQRAGRPHGSRAHDGTIITEQVDVMWGTDLTSVMTGEGQAAVFITVDHCSAECVGIHASRSADRFQALEPVKQAVRQCHGGFAKGIAAGLRLRHDHGSQYVSHDFQAESRFLGIASPPAFVRVGLGNSPRLTAASSASSASGC